MGQEQLAEMLGMNERSIRHYESGNAFPRSEVIDRLCEIFEMEPGDWFPLTGEEMDQAKALAMIRKGLEFLEVSQIQEDLSVSKKSTSAAHPSRHVGTHGVEGFGRIEIPGSDDGAESADGAQ